MSPRPLGPKPFPPRMVAVILDASGSTVERVLTHQGFQHNVDALEGTLRQRAGLAAGQRLAILGRNSAEYLELLHACAAAHVIAVPLNVRWSVQDIAAAIADCGAACVAVLDPDFETLATTQEQPLVGHNCCVLRPPNATSLEWTVTHTGERSRAGGKLDEESNLAEIHSIVYTSGTTGKANGTVLTHAAQHVQAGAKCAILGYGPSTRVLNVAPLFHVGGLNSSLAVSRAGGCHVFLPRFKAAAAASAISVAEVNLLVVVPAMLHAILSAANSATQQVWPTVTTILVGGQPIVPKLRAAAERAFPNAAIIQTYACTEACSSMTFLPLPRSIGDSSGSTSCSSRGGGRGGGSSGGGGSSSGSSSSINSRSSGSRGRDGVELALVGRPPAHVQLRITPLDDDASSTIPWREGEQGENDLPLKNSKAALKVGRIETRGPHVMRGYWQKPEQTRLALTSDGWLRTGDLGALNAGGDLFFAGREGDCMRSGGETVWSSEVEAALLKHPEVAEAAAFPLPDEALGQRVAAAVVRVARKTGFDSPKKSPASGDASFVDDVSEWCRKRLAGFKRPRAVFVVAELPRNSNGKVMKHRLAERFAAEEEVESQRRPVARL